MYPAEEVARDQAQLEAFQNTPGYQKSREHSDSRSLEKTFMSAVELGDWFSEGENYNAENPDYSALVTFPTSEIDDVFNHVDVVCMIRNEATDYESVPFAIDLTCNTHDSDINRKLRWRHVYGKNETVPEANSEFGVNYVSKEDYNKGIVVADVLSLKSRQGLKIPGFASIKYFEDKNNPWNPVYEKGRINIMPRFVVGYSTDITDTLAVGKPTFEYMQKYGEQEYQKRQLEYETAEKRAKWCTLFECYEQTEDIQYMLEHINTEEIAGMHLDELETARRQIKVMHTYFNKAIGAAIAKTNDDPSEKEAMNYAAKSDPVHNIISKNSAGIYRGKSYSLPLPQFPTNPTANY